MKPIKHLVFFFLLISCSQSQYDIAFVSNRNGNLDIYITNSDTAEFVNLTNSDVDEYGLSWSADGNYVYFTRYSGTNRQVCFVNKITGEINNVISDSTIISVFDVSSDNKSLLIVSSEHNRKGEIYLYSLETREKARLTNNDYYESGAKFSPNEKAIVTSIQTNMPDSINHGGNAEIFQINLVDLKITQLTNLKGFNGLPAYSPEGKKIVFHNCNNGQCDIFVMNSDGGQLINLTNDIEDNRWPRWTPDGKWIAFSRTINGNSEIYFITPDGLKIKPVITSKYRDEIAEIL